MCFHLLKFLYHLSNIKQFIFFFKYSALLLQDLRVPQKYCERNHSNTSASSLIQEQIIMELKAQLLANI